MTARAPVNAKIRSVSSQPASPGSLQLGRGQREDVRATDGDTQLGRQRGSQVRVQGVTRLVLTLPVTVDSTVARAALSPGTVQTSTSVCGPMSGLSFTFVPTRRTGVASCGGTTSPEPYRSEVP